MQRGSKSVLLAFAGAVLAFAVLAVLPLWILPEPHPPFHYLLAGAFATGFAMAAILVFETLRRTSRR